jgi:hypothetical protein
MPHAFSLSPTYLLFFRWLTRHAPRILSIFVNLEARNSLRDPVEAFHESLLEAPPSDLEMCNKMPGIESMFVESTLEMYTRGQSSTECYELSLWGKSWGFELKELKGDEARSEANKSKNLRIKVWQGEHDIGTTPAMAEYIARETGAKLRVVEGKGHMLYFEIWDDVLEWLVTE